VRFAIHLTALLALRAWHARRPSRLMLSSMAARPAASRGAAAAREGKQVVFSNLASTSAAWSPAALALRLGNRAAILAVIRVSSSRGSRLPRQKYGAASAAGEGLFGWLPTSSRTSPRRSSSICSPRQGRGAFRERLDKVHKENAHIRSITTEKGNQFTAALFIDASYEGDLMARRRLVCHCREGGGVQRVAGWRAAAQSRPSMAIRISPFDSMGRLLPLVQAGPAGAEGMADQKTQAYNFRLCMTDRRTTLSLGRSRRI